jgi:vesicle coat complex subunit
MGRKHCSILLNSRLSVFMHVVKFFVLMRLEKGDVTVKTEALKRVIYQIINGDKMPGLLMVIIR